jgi:arginyl-tRNA synthetase
MARPDLIDPALGELADRIRHALEAAGLPAGDPALERPKQADHGDWATTVPLRLAKPAKRPPREIAQALLDELELPDTVASAEVAGPGFVNFRWSHRYHEQLVRRIVAEGAAYGRRQVAEPETVNAEFVSANPTGPLHVGAGRWIATGDAIAALLEAAGHRVVREYYVNDAGEQVRRFGESVALVGRGEPLADEHYQGDYLREIAEDLRAEHGDEVFTTAPDGEVTLGGGEHVDDDEDGAVADADPRVDPRVSSRVGLLAVEAMRRRIEHQLHRMGVDYDVWFSERSLHESGAIAAAIEKLTADDRTYESDGALFLRTTDFGDDKDRVLVRSDGRPTYFAADCAYLLDKWGRADRLYYLLGADHHGYVVRLHAAAECLGIPRDRVEIRIGQLVNLLRGGQPVRMSKRAGDLVTIDEVLDEVGPDVARYHFLRVGLDTTLDFDLATVAERSMENPVYYVQYAHARIHSLIRTADERGFDHGAIDDADLTRLSHPAELELLGAMAQLPLVVDEAASLRATQRLARYAEELAATFHRFYTECRILAPDDPDRTPAEQAELDELGRARYWLAVAAKQVLANALALLRVSAPERL